MTRFDFDCSSPRDQASAEQVAADEGRAKTEALAREKADLVDELQQRLVSRILLLYGGAQ